MRFGERIVDKLAIGKLKAKKKPASKISEDGPRWANLFRKDPVTELRKKQGDQNSYDCECSKLL